MSHGRAIAACAVLPSRRYRARPAGLRLEDGPVIVPRIAGALKQLAPLLGPEVGLRRQHPVLEELALLGRAVGIDLDEARARRDALQLAHGCEAALGLEVVHRVDG